jgi:DNA-binding CsgD family transcriptional regulator
MLPDGPSRVSICTAAGVRVTLAGDFPPGGTDATDGPRMSAGWPSRSSVLVGRIGNVMVGSSVPLTIRRVAVAAMIRVVSAPPPRPVRYVLPVLLVIAATGSALLLTGVVGRGALAVLFVPVLVVAVVLGLPVALATVALTAGVVPLLLEPIGSLEIADSAQLSAVGLELAEGTLVAFIGGGMRAVLHGVLDRARGQEGRPSSTVTPAVPALVEPLTPRELEILRMAAAGGSVDQLAEQLSLSPNTVKTHLAHCYDKLGARNRAGAIALAVAAGSLEATDLERAAHITGDR